jgi:hypothetical protein
MRNKDYGQPGYVSYVKKGVNTGRTYKNIPNVNYPLNDITYYTGSFSDCPTICDNTPGCVGYVPDKNRGQNCWLKNSFINRSTYNTTTLDINFIERDPNAPQVIFYIDCWYSGRSVNLQVGDYPWIEDVGFPNDTLSSLVVPAGLTVELYWDWHFTGPMIKYVGPVNVECLTNAWCPERGRSWNDQVSSMKVYYT